MRSRVKSLYDAIVLSWLVRHRALGDKYFVHEEEVPRADAIVTRKYQRARWMDGKTVVWLGQRKQAGRGEGSSDLKFDQIEDIKAEIT